MAKHMVGLFNVRLSLWAKSVVDSSTRIAVLVSLAVTFLLNSVGVGLFEFTKNGAKAASTLVQASEALLLILGLSLLGAVVFVRFSADRPRIDRLVANMFVFFMGAGLLTITSQSIRLAAAFFIWKPFREGTGIILSKPMFYASGWAVDILMVAFYALVRADILFGPPAPVTSVSEPKRPAAGALIKVESRELPLRMNPIRTVYGDDGRYGPWTTAPDDTYHSAGLGSTRIVTSVAKDRFSVESVPLKDVESAEPVSTRRSMFIAISRTFSVSSNRKSSATQ